MAKKFKVNVGYDRLGRERNRYFPTLEAARAMVNDYFRRTKTVLSIVEVTRDKESVILLYNHA